MRGAGCVAFRPGSPEALLAGRFGKGDQALTPDESLRSPHPFVICGRIWSPTRLRSSSASLDHDVAVPVSFRALFGFCHPCSRSFCISSWCGERLYAQASQFKAAWLPRHTALAKNRISAAEPKKSWRSSAALPFTTTRLCGYLFIWEPRISFPKPPILYCLEHSPCRPINVPVLARSLSTSAPGGPQQPAASFPPRFRRSAITVS